MGLQNLRPYAPRPLRRSAVDEAYMRADRELEALLAGCEPTVRFHDLLERWHRDLLEIERESGASGAFVSAGLENAFSDPASRRPETTVDVLEAGDGTAEDGAEFDACASFEERRERWVCAWKVREIETFREAFDAESSLRDSCAPFPQRPRPFRADAQTLAAAHYAAYAPAIHAEAQALELRQALARLRRRARAQKKAGAWREEPRSSLEAWEAQEHAYWTRYFTVLLTWQHALDRSAKRDCAEPLSKKVPPFVAARMNDFYAAMTHEPAWPNTP